jgi:stage II sporulation protein D
MKITGTKGSGTIKGIRVRWALGLRENLFVVDRTVDRNGKVKEFVFTGRGWGHGVGMCQIGALGYARMGKDYRAILQHYYTNVQINKAY